MTQLAILATTIFGQMNNAEAEAAAQAAGAAAGAVFFFIMLVVVLISIIPMWVVFSKAGKPGWASIVPIYNMIVLLEICGRPIWWLLLMFIPCVNIVFAIMLLIDLAKAFGKGAGFGVGLILLTPIFMMILAFSSAKYEGPPNTPA